MCSAPHAPKRTSLAKQTSRPKGTSRSAQAEHIVQPTQKARLRVPFVLAGMAGFEPTSARVKVWCLTAWRHPNIELPSVIISHISFAVKLFLLYFPSFLAACQKSPLLLPLLQEIVSFPKSQTLSALRTSQTTIPEGALQDFSPRFPARLSV